jgi:FKBP-type peptidyl-prolyl cis-trans isomerase 2
MTHYSISIITRLQKVVPVMFLLLTVVTGCASVGKNEPLRTDASDMPKTRLVQTGDLVDLRFLCRLQTGEVVAATDRSLGQRPDVAKSTIFLMRDKDGPVSVTADVLLPMTERPAGKELAFEDEIVERLAGAVLGMKEGEDRTVRLTAQEAPERRPEDYVMKVARVRVRAKEMRMSLDDFRSRIGRSPEAGQPVLFDPAVPGRVETVMADEAVIRFSAQPGAVTTTPFGPGHIRETEKAYEIVIDARKGALVRSGMLVGRIVDVDENSITIDYRHPFGNEVLVCDVAIDRVADAKPINNGSGE